MDTGHALGKDSHCDWRRHARPLPTHLVIKQQRSSLSLSHSVALSRYLHLLLVCCACALATVACHKCAIKLYLIPVRTWSGGLAAAEDATVRCRRRCAVASAVSLKGIQPRAAFIIPFFDLVFYYYCSYFSYASLYYFFFFLFLLFVFFVPLLGLVLCATLCRRHARI